MESYSFKIVLLGEGRVGKTSLVLRYIENRFTDRQTSTIQASFLEKRLNFGNSTVSLKIWDTAGQERFHALAPIYYRDSNGAILVYDITDSTSFNKCTHWVEELRKVVGDDIKIILAANKQDLAHKRVVDSSQAAQYANNVGASIIGCSAKTGNGVEELFLEMTKELLRIEKEKRAIQARHSGGTGGRTGGSGKYKLEITDDLDGNGARKKKKDGGCCEII